MQPISSLKHYSLLIKYICKIIPEAKQQLYFWSVKALDCHSVILTDQAYSSIENKAFHTLGGSVYVLYPSIKKHNRKNYLKFITSLQTTSDYLDNLCDRTNVYDEDSFRQLHCAINDSLICSESRHDYYKYYPYQNDSGYLNLLVNTCKLAIVNLPSLQLIEKDLQNYALLYSEMQTYKHLSLSLREEKLINWCNDNLKDSDKLNGIYWNEFAAASGSTLGIFVLTAAAHDPDLTKHDIQQLKEVYFPWICGLHILLDYYIDKKDDFIHGDLNFVSYYNNHSEMQSRIMLFIDNSLQKAAELKEAWFHQTIIQGLLALYLSDPKALTPDMLETSKALLKKGGSRATALHKICLLLRKLKII